MNDNIYNLFEREFGPDIFQKIGDQPIAVPENYGILTSLIRCASGNGIKICVTGGGTVVKPFPFEDAVWVSTKKLNRIKEINTGDFLLSAESGVIVDDAVNAAREKGFCMPLEIPYGAQSTFGGAYMTDAWGLTAKIHGSFKDSVIGVKCLTSDGNAVSFGGRTAKNVTGYEVTRFLAGSYGVFALNTELIVKLSPEPEKRCYITVSFDDTDNFCTAIDAVISGVVKIYALEIFAEKNDRKRLTLTAGFEGMSGIVDSNAGIFMKIAGNYPGSDIKKEEYADYCNRRREYAGVSTAIVSFPPASAGFIIKKILGMPGNFSMTGNISFGKLFISEMAISADLFQTLDDFVLSCGGKHIVKYPDFQLTNAYGAGKSGEAGSMLKSLKMELDPKNMFNPYMKII